MAYPILSSVHTKYSLMLPAARPLNVIHASGWHSACLVIVSGMFHCSLHPANSQHKNLFNVQVWGPEESIHVSLSLKMN
ncbi:hypothetical protein K5549_008205 [Capra hircus]|uniref:Uncharacterized protein n=1 Tax=Capra hircus TaxID=9925 RepID=A0A452GBP0_CAPHI|nr:hypothetical protein K5549_008205 [Capra hircus]